MAKRLSGFVFSPSGRRGKYPWRQWFDGSAWQLEHGEDFLIPTGQFTALVHGQARRWGGKARTQTDGKSVVIQFYVPVQQ